MNRENQYLKVIRARYLSLIIMPLIVISGPIYYAYCFLTNSMSADKLMFADIPVTIFVIVLIIMFIKGLGKSYAEGFAQAIRLLVVAITIMGWWHYLSTSVERTIDRFYAKRDYYIREIAVRSSEDHDGKGKLIEFNLKPTGTVSRSIVFDETDTLTNSSNKHRGLGKNFSENEIRVIKIEPQFYYVRRYYPYEIDTKFTNIEE